MRWSMLRRRGKGRSSLSAMALERAFRPLDRLLLPGRVVPGDRSRDCAVALDVDYHKRTAPSTPESGCREGPQKGSGKTDEFWYGNYEINLLVNTTCCCPGDTAALSMAMSSSIRRTS